MKKTTLLYVLAQLFSIVVLIINRIIYARFLNEESFGIYSLLNTSILFTVLLVSFGIGQSLSYHFSLGKLNENSILSSIIYYSIFFGLISLLLYNGVFSYFYPNIDGNLVVVSSLCIPVILFINISTYLFIALEKGAMYFLLNSFYLFLAIPIFLTLNLIFPNHPLTISLISLLASSTISGVLIFIQLKLNITFTKTVLRIKEIKEIFIYGIKIYGTSILNFFNYRFDILLIGVYLGNKSVAIYTISVLAADSFGKISHSISVYIFSKTKKIQAEQERRKLLRKSLLGTLSVVTLGLLLFVSIGQILFVYIFGKEYSTSYSYFLLLIPGIYFISVFRLVYQSLASIGKPLFGTITTFFSMIFTIVCNLVFLPVFGLVAAPIISSLAYLISMILIMFFYYNKGKRSKNE